MGSYRLDWPVDSRKTTGFLLWWTMERGGPLEKLTSRSTASINVPQISKPPDSIEPSPFIKSCQTLIAFLTFTIVNSITYRFRPAKLCPCSTPQRSKQINLFRLMLELIAQKTKVNNQSLDENKFIAVKPFSVRKTFKVAFVNWILFTLLLLLLLIFLTYFLNNHLNVHPVDWR